MDVFVEAIRSTSENSGANEQHCPTWHSDARNDCHWLRARTRKQLAPDRVSTQADAAPGNTSFGLRQSDAAVPYPRTVNQLASDAERQTRNCVHLGLGLSENLRQTRSAAVNGCRALLCAFSDVLERVNNTRWTLHDASCFLLTPKRG